METLLQDLRYAARGLFKTPGFTLALALTLGLGIGAGTAMFGVVDALLLRPLPYGDPAGLAHVWAVSPNSGREMRYLPLPEARAWNERADFLDGALLHERGSALYIGGAEPTTLMTETVSPNFEEVLRVRPALGRDFADADAGPGAERVVLLGHGFWRTAFGADAAIVGRHIELDGDRHRVIGVMPATFKFPEYASTEAWLPLSTAGAGTPEQDRRVEVLARIGQQSPEVAQARAEAFAAALGSEMRAETGWGAKLMPMQEMRARNPELLRGVWFLVGAVALILLVAAANAVGLLLVRGWSRTREMAVRTALGASTGRIVRQMLVESTLLSLLSGIAAVLLALGIVGAMRGILPEAITFFAPYETEVNRRTLAFAFAVAATAGLIVGLLPALQAARRGAIVASAGLTPYAAHTPGKFRLRRALVAGAVGLSVMLLVGAGLLINSFARLLNVDPGYRVEALAIMNLTLSTEYGSPEQRGALLQRVEERLEALPGVQGVTVPGGGFHFGVALEREGSGTPAPDQPMMLPFAEVTPDYFGVLGVPIRAGRAFTPEDAGTDNIIIDQDLARALWGGVNPIGRRFRPDPNAPWKTVVGVIGDLRLMGPDARQGNFEMLYPASKETASSFSTVFIRTRGDPTALFPALRAAVHEVDPRQPIGELRRASDVYAETTEMPRFLLFVTSVLSGAALLLAAIGIYGLLAFTVAQNERGLGIRIALGARPAMLVRAVVQEGLALALAGVAFGIAGSLALSGVVRGVLYGVEPTDPGTVAAVAAVVLFAAAVAAYLPARRATRVDPVIALRAE